MCVCVCVYMSPLLTHQESSAGGAGGTAGGGGIEKGLEGAEVVLGAL